MARRAATKKWTLKERKAKFLTQLLKCPNVSAAAQFSGLGRQYAYRLRNEDKQFSMDWDSTLEVAVDNWEQECIRRATVGVERPVFQQGQLVGHLQEYSDTLMIVLLKAHRPKYREAHSVHFAAPEKDAEPLTIRMITDAPPEKKPE